MAIFISFIVGLLLGVIGMKLTRKTSQATPAAISQAAAPAAKVSAKPQSVLKDSWLAGLGGEQNVQQAEAIAATRVRVSLQDGTRLNESALKQAGVLAVAPINAQVFHLIVGA